VVEKKKRKKKKREGKKEDPITIYAPLFAATRRFRVHFPREQFAYVEELPEHREHFAYA
jgi:hypothetical protein